MSTKTKMNEQTKTRPALKLTTRGRYAIMAMIYLAEREVSKPFPLSDIAQDGQISLSYLEQLFSGLRRHGLVRSYRGPGGGYALARPAAEIGIADIMLAAEDCAPARRTAANQADIDAVDHVRTDQLWTQIGHVLHACLQHVTLEDVVKDRLQDNPHLSKLFETLG